MTNKNVYAYEDLLREYKKKFGEELRITGIDWMQDAVAYWRRRSIRACR